MAEMVDDVKAEEGGDCTFVGIDVGASSTMVVSGTGEIVRNELGGHSNASIVGFFGNERFIGEAGVSQLTTNAANTIPVGQILSLNEALGGHARYEVTKDETFVVSYANKEQTFRKESLLGALLKKLGALAAERFGSVKISIAAPPCWTEGQRQVLTLAARAARLELQALASSDECLRRVYALKHAPSIEGRRVVAIVDIGRCTATCTVAEFDSHGESRCFATESIQDKCGTAALDAALYDYLRSKLDKNVPDPKPGTKKGARLLGAVERLRKLLSTMKEAKVTCENLGDDCDVPLHATRDDLKSAASEILETLRTFLTATKETTLAKLEETAVDSEAKVDAVEVVGGGGRVAIFRDLIAEVFGVDDLGAKLDDASIAHGAALVAANAVSEEQKDANGDVTMADDSLAALEDEMAIRDAAVALVAERRNALETRILELRSARNGPNGELLENPKLTEGIDGAEAWLWETEADEPGPFAEKLIELDQLARDLCPTYFAAIDAEKARVEAELLEAEKEAGSDDDEAREDRLNADTRKLKFSDRFRLVQKNKDEGTELFKGGNIHHSIKRYRDALAHAAKFSSLSPDQEQQAKKIKLDLHLNIALCWSKPVPKFYILFIDLFLIFWFSDFRLFFSLNFFSK